MSDEPKHAEYGYEPELHALNQAFLAHSAGNGVQARIHDMTARLAGVHERNRIKRLTQPIGEEENNVTPATSA